LGRVRRIDKEVIMTRSKNRWTQTVVALAATCGLVLGTTAAAGAAPGAGAFSAQARSVGLSSAETRELQSAVTAEIARAGGTQVALNRIERPGATVLLPLPGEAYAHNLDAPASRTAAGRLMAEPCPRLNFCQYSNIYFQGMVEQRSACTDYNNYLRYDGSWINNQSRGTVTYMRDKGGVIRFSAAAPSQDDVAPWDWVGSIKVC
jgi:hypothetical protein